MMEAKNALTAAGYVVSDEGTNTLHVTRREIPPEDLPRGRSMQEIEDWLAEV